jgi:hypothetical protein
MWVEWLMCMTLLRGAELPAADAGCADAVLVR